MFYDHVTYLESEIENLEKINDELLKAVKFLIDHHPDSDQGRFAQEIYKKYLKTA